MNLLNSHSLLNPLQPIFISSSSSPSPRTLSLPPLSFISKTPKAFHLQNAFSPTTTTICFSPLCSPSKREFRKKPRVSDREALIWSSGEGDDDDTDGSMEFEDIATDGVVYKKTLRLVECSMFAAVTGLAYFLSNSLAIENYFGCFFSLPIVISSLRWDLSAGRKTMVATSMLLLTLSGPVKAATYLLMHGLVGLAMGSLWRLGANWGLSIAACTLIRAVGLMGYVLLSSFLIRENILALITANLHASLSYVLTAIGVNTIPSMTLIYSIFGMVLLLNCVFFVFLLHILYAVFLARLGMKASLTLPRWLEKAI